MVERSSKAVSHPAFLDYPKCSVLRMSKAWGNTSCSFLSDGVRSRPIVHGLPSPRQAAVQSCGSLEDWPSAAVTSTGHLFLPKVPSSCTSCCFFCHNRTVIFSCLKTSKHEVKKSVNLITQEEKRNQHTFNCYKQMHPSHTNQCSATETQNNRNVINCNASSLWSPLEYQWRLFSNCYRKDKHHLYLFCLLFSH